MGCGSSTPAVVLVDGEKVKSAVDKKLAMHLSAILGIPSNHPSIEMYVERLTSEGCETPKMFDLFTLDELKEPPFCFKRGHLKMVAHARDEEAKETGGGGHSRARATLTLEPRPDSSTRGKCSVCGIDVLDSQPRLKDPKTGFYQHQHCPAVDAAQIGEAAKSNVENMGNAAASSVAESAPSPLPNAGATTSSLPTALAPTIKPLLPDGKHAFLSYQWDVQEQVKGTKELLKEFGVKCTDAFETRAH